MELYLIFWALFTIILTLTLITFFKKGNKKASHQNFFFILTLVFTLFQGIAITTYFFTNINVAGVDVKWMLLFAGLVSIWYPLFTFYEACFKQKDNTLSNRIRRRK
jgi:hypothetical protein